MKKVLIAMSFLGCMGALVMAQAPQQQPTVVTVNGKAVLQSDFLQRLWNIHGQTVLDMMIDEKLMQQEADRLKVKPLDKTVDARVARIRQQFPDGKAFEEQLKRAGSTLDNLKAQIRLNLLTEETVIKAKNIKVTKQDLESYFNQNKDKLATPESVRLRHILVKTQKEADAILLALNAGADFSKLAAQQSTDEATKANGGDMGFVTKGILLPDVEKAVFGLKTGLYSNIITSNAGFHILKVEDRRESKPADFKKMQEDIELFVTSSKVTQALPELLKDLRGKAKIEYPQAPPQQPVK